MDKLMPLLFRHTAPLFAIWHITEDAESLLATLYNKETYRPLLDILHTDMRRSEWLACRVLLQTLLEREVTVDYLPNGAPILRDSSFSISFSHTRGYAAALIAPGSSAGIDIEYRSDRVKKIRSRFMREDEDATIDPAHESDHLLIYWCAKETLFKLLGEEEVDFREHLLISPFSFSKQGILFAQEFKTPRRQDFQLAFRVEEPFVLVWSEKSNISPFQ